MRPARYHVHTRAPANPATDPPWAPHVCALVPLEPPGAYQADTHEPRALERALDADREVIKWQRMS